jgi:hypothetical protein
MVEKPAMPSRDEVVSGKRKESSGTVIPDVPDEGVIALDPSMESAEVALPDEASLSLKRKKKKEEEEEERRKEPSADPERWELSVGERDFLESDSVMSPAIAARLGSRILLPADRKLYWGR